MWTKAEMAKLSVEQQEVLARFELSKFRQREQLVKIVRGRDWRSRCIPIVICIPCVIILILMLCKFFNSKEMPYVIFALNGSTLFGCVICALNARMNQRMDALLELLDLDHKNHDESPNSKDEKIG